MNALIYHNQSVRLAATTARASVCLSTLPLSPPYIQLIFGAIFLSIRLGLENFYQVTHTPRITKQSHSSIKLKKLLSRKLQQQQEEQQSIDCLGSQLFIEILLLFENRNSPKRSIVRSDAHRQLDSNTHTHARSYMHADKIQCSLDGNHSYKQTSSRRRRSRNRADPDQLQLSRGEVREQRQRQRATTKATQSPRPSPSQFLCLSLSRRQPTA